MAKKVIRVNVKSPKVTSNKKGISRKGQDKHEKYGRITANRKTEIIIYNSF